MILLAQSMSVENMLDQMVPGMFATLSIFFMTLLFSLPLGIIICWGRMSKIKPISLIFKLYIAIMRGTPLMLQLFVVYYVPNIMLKLGLRNYEFTAVIIAFSLNYAAYYAEIYRSGVESIPKGQHEAADILGYSKFQSFRKIICPQVIKVILPPMTNEIICLVKDTSIAFAIAYAEMFTIAKRIVASQATMMPFVIAAVFYFVFNALVAFVMGKIEKAFDYYNR